MASTCQMFMALSTACTPWRRVRHVSPWWLRTLNPRA
jgi:hypothetical protein